MQILITGRHMEVSPALRRYIETRIRRLERYASNVGDVQVIVAVEKYRHTAEILFRLNGRVMQAKSSTSEMYSSVDGVVDKVLHQVRKRKDRLVSHKVRNNTIRTKGAVIPVSQPLVKTTRPVLHTLTVQEAIEQLEGQHSGILVFMNADVGRVQVMRRSDNGTPEIIDPQPA